MKAAYVVLIVAATLLGGCSGDKGKELFDTAQFEEKQNNRPHAIQLYEELVAKHPGSPLAKKAQERLDVLKQQK